MVMQKSYNFKCTLSLLCCAHMHRKGKRRCKKTQSYGVCAMWVTHPFDFTKRSSCSRDTWALWVNKHNKHLPRMKIGVLFFVFFLWETSCHLKCLSKGMWRCAGMWRERERAFAGSNHWFQLLRYEDLLDFLVFHDSKVNSFRAWDTCRKKTSHLNRSDEGVDNWLFLLYLSDMELYLIFVTFVGLQHPPRLHFEIGQQLPFTSIWHLGQWKFQDALTSFLRPRLLFFFLKNTNY